jgi:uncharacterized protein GlcG (DUF336 family)
MNTNLRRSLCAFAMLAPLVAVDATAQGEGAAPRSGSNACNKLPGHAELKAALSAARAEANGGFNLDMWGTLVDRDGNVCAVAFTGTNRGEQWPGSRVISAQKANTANAFSLPALALSTANLYAAVQPGGTLYGLQHSNPVSTAAAYAGPPSRFGQSNDPLVGSRIGGINVFGGGLALYDEQGTLIGGVGVSGDTSCADHNIAWRTRHALELDYVPSGVSDRGDDNINYQGLVDEPSLANDFSHPICKIAGEDQVSSISASLPNVRKLEN